MDFLKWFTVEKKTDKKADNRDEVSRHRNEMISFLMLDALMNDKRGENKTKDKDEE